MNFTKEEREAYEDHLKWLRIEANSLKKAEEKGRKEEKLEIARNMLNESLPIEKIAALTGLTEKEVKNLQK